VDLISLSRAVSHALRHEPWLYELELDSEGWVPVESLIAAIRAESSAMTDVSTVDLLQMIDRSDKKRHQIQDDKIRALYGHSTPQKIQKQPGQPPTLLFHGTSPELASRISSEGLKPMGRQYVHLSTDMIVADQVGKRKAPHPVIVTVCAENAWQAGVRFYRGNDRVWLVDEMPPSFLS
jgi:putative RNA 2'-phosphotransferase